MGKEKIAKPIIFLSHSSSDADILTRIEKTIIEITNSTLDIFMSSDKKSITLGTNWYQGISSHLNKMSLLFAFLSPRALQSQWVSFECGYASARKVPIIPIAFNGLLIEEIGPPLGNYQGINLIDADGLNKIIDAINHYFDHHHTFDFTDNDFKKVIMGKFDKSFQPPKSGKYRVYTRDGNDERRHESVTIEIEEKHMTARTVSWDSAGLLVDNRFVGRFGYLREPTSSRCGIHDLTWNGKEFIGTAGVDSGAWKVDILIWRPEDD